MIKKYSSLILSTSLLLSCTTSPDSFSPGAEFSLNTNQLTAPPKGFTIPPRHLTAPPKGFTIPPRSVSAPPKGFTLVEGRVTFPASTNKNLFSIPPRGLTAPPKGFTVPPRGFTIPPLGVTIPPRGFETQSLQPNALRDLTYAINGTPIPDARILTQQVIQKPNGELEVTFLTNALPEQNHVIFSATSPSGLVVLGQYMEGHRHFKLKLNLEETALALIKSTTEGANRSLSQLRQAPQTKQLTEALNTAIQQNTLSSSILNTPEVQQILENKNPDNLDSPDSTATTLATITLQPSTFTLNQVGDTQILQALAVGPTGKNQTTLSYQWSSNNSEVATVNSQGIVTATGVGSTTIKARAENLEGIAVVTVQEEAQLKPKITSMTPVQGKSGDTITINGDRFATLPAKNTVKFGSQTLEVVANSSREIVLNVPDNFVQGNTTISIETETGISNSETFTVLSSPAITTVSPGFGPTGTSVTLTGTGFSPTPADNIVKFNGLSATVTQASFTSLSVTVPAGVTPGPITLTVLDETVTGPQFSSLPSGLTHYWNAENNAQDQIGSNHGSEQGSGYTSGSSGQGFDFDGVDDYVDMGTFELDTSNQAVTIAFWFKANAGVLGTDGRMISKATGTAVTDHYFMVSNHTVTGNDRLRFRLKTSVGDTTTLIASSGNLSANVWTFATATYDGSTMRLYKDANDVGSTGKSGTIITNPAIPVWIGNNPPTPSIVPWDGAIDEVQIYNRALSQPEIQALYDATKP